MALTPVAALAATQGGHVTHAQLLSAGVSATSIRRLVNRGVLHRVFRGVYAVGAVPTDPLPRCQGALLACGGRSTVAFDSAAAYWQMIEKWPATPELWVATDHHPKGITVRHTDNRARTEISEPQQNFRVTTPARTLMDQAGLVRVEKDFTWMVSNTLVRRRVTPGQIRSVVEAHPRHRGAQRLGRVLMSLPNGQPFRSPWEIDWPPFVTRHGLDTGYVMNAPIGGARVDILYPGRLVIWMDGWQTHQLKSAFEQDRAEANEILANLGIPALRITYDQLHDTPARCAGWVRGALARTS